MRKVPLIIGVLVLLALVDLGAKSWAQSQLASATKSRSQNVGAVSVRYEGLPDSVSGFPFAWSVLGDGKVGTATIELRDVTVSPLPMSLLRMKVTDLGVGRGAYFGSGRKIKSNGPVRVTVRLTAANLQAYYSGPVQLRPGYIRATVKGVVYDGKASVKGRTIVITDTQRGPTSLPMPGTEYLPCTPTGVGVSPSGVVLSCTSKSLPSYAANILK